MKVLLISPLPKIDPACGDVTYTQMLLANPPEGVEYEDYWTALQNGNLREHGTPASLRLAWQTKQNLVRETLLTLSSTVVNRLRSKRLLYWEPQRFFSIAPGVFDAVHMHVFSARFFALPCPLLISNAAAQQYLYTDARKYSAARGRILLAIEKSIGKAMKVNLNAYSMPQATRVIAQTQYFKDEMIKYRRVPPENLEIVPFYLPDESVSLTPKEKPFHIGFVALEFEAKGGPTLLEAFAQVRSLRPDARLTIVGSPPQISEEEGERRGIRWFNRVPRTELLGEIMPSFDVFAYPTRFDGQPFVILETMSRGIALAVSDYHALPEMVDYGKAGLISPMGDAGALAQNIVKLLDPQNNLEYRHAARTRFENYFAADVARPKLKSAYETAIRDFQTHKADVSLRIESRPPV